MADRQRMNQQLRCLHNKWEMRARTYGRRIRVITIYYEHNALYIVGDCQ